MLYRRARQSDIPRCGDIAPPLEIEESLEERFSNIWTHNYSPGMRLRPRCLFVCVEHQKSAACSRYI